MIKHTTVLILVLASVLALATSVPAQQGAKGGGPPAAKASPAAGSAQTAGRAHTPAPADAAAQESAKTKAALDSFIMPATVELIDYPNDDGRSLALKFPKSPSESPNFTYVVYVSKSAG